MTRARDVSSRNGLTQVIPTSVAVGSGSGSVGANGVVTFTSASSVSINGCFTSTYSNYRVVANVTGTSTSTLTFFRFISGGSVDSGSNYMWSKTVVAPGYGPLRLGASAGNYLEGPVPYAGYTLAHSSIDIISPQLSAYTVGTMLDMNSRTSPDFMESRHGGFFTTVTTQYDGLHYNANGNTFTGTMRIYGYNNG
jgi:hypothetical protein